MSSPPPPARVAGGRFAPRAGAARVLWRNELGGVTWDLGDGTVLKWSPPGAPALGPEVDRLRWAARFAAVPDVLDAGTADDGQWMLTRRVPGRSAVDPAWRARPAAAVEGLGRGLRALHDALPVDACPFAWSVAERLTTVTPGTPPDVRAALADPPPLDVAVVCHGDACAPNTLLDDAGSPIAHVDLGSLGVADRWADIAVATLSLTWNYDGDHEARFLDAYGVAPDPARAAYYRALWNSTGDAHVVPGG